jgi:hypothetical protein
MKIRIASVSLYSLGVRIDRVDPVTSALQLSIYCIGRLLEIPRDARDSNVLLAEKLGDLFWYL